MTLRDYVEYLVGIRELEKDEFKFNRIQDYNKKVNRFKLIVIDYDITQIPESKEDYSPSSFLQQALHPVLPHNKE